MALKQEDEWIPVEVTVLAWQSMGSSRVGHTPFAHAQSRNAHCSRLESGGSLANVWDLQHL